MARARRLHRHPAQRPADAGVRRPGLGKERRRLTGRAAPSRRDAHGPAPNPRRARHSPGAYVRDQVQLLYAATTHRAQGTTVDTAHPLITEGMTREALYVLATRARERTVLYVATHDLPFDDDAHVNLVQHDPSQYAGHEILLSILAAEGAALPATETIATAQEEAGSLATLVPRYLHAARTAHLETAGSPVTDLLPWVPGPQCISADRASVPLRAYLDDATALITARVNDLADTAARHRPPWMSHLGLQPADPDRAREWLRHLAVVAAYRDQHKITTDDPSQIVGPYAEPGHADHNAYRHAAEAVLAARHLANGAAAQGRQADAEHIADTYRNPPAGGRGHLTVATKQAILPEFGRRQPAAESGRRAGQRLPRSAATDVPEPVRQSRPELLIPPPAPTMGRAPQHGPR